MKIIKRAVEQAVKELGWEEVEFVVEHPREEAHGDYSTNVALVVAKKLDKKPREVANQLVSSIKYQVSGICDKVEVAGAGFINFYLKSEYLLEEMKRATQSGYGQNAKLDGKRVTVEYTDPNPFKELHIGHLMSNAIGESLARIIEAQGARVTRANYQGDVGLHVAKAIYGLLCKILNTEILNTKQIQISKEKIQNWIAEWSQKSLNERQKMMGETYAYGATKYEEDPPAGEAGESAKSEIHELNKQIYEGNEADLMELYKKGREWSLEYFEVIYQRLGTKFDEYFFESEAGPIGLKVVEEGLVKGVLEEGEKGAIVYKGEKEGLHTRVFRNALGLATYEGKELGLAKTKFERTHYDLSYIVTANEITEYFKVLLAVMKKLYPELAAKTTHLPHGMMKLTTGKMSSRTGKVVTGEGLLNDLQAVVLEKMGERVLKDRETVADKVAIGALKFTILRQQIGGDIVYQPEKMTNLEGATGPYIQYTYARTQSVLAKVGAQVSGIKYPVSSINDEEMAILRWLYRYGEVVAEAGKSLAPHLIATYVYELAARFNTFYNKHQIVGNELRVELTQAVANVIESGLKLLGIVAPTEM